MQKEWYKIKNNASEASDVYLFNDIGTFGITAQSFIDEIKEYDNKELNIHINSFMIRIISGRYKGHILNNISTNNIRM